MTTLGTPSPNDKATYRIRPMAAHGLMLHDSISVEERQC